MEKYSEEKLNEQLNNGEMTYVEYIEQHDEDVRDEYEQFCKDNGLDPKAEESAMEFIDIREELLDSNTEI